jgi:diguanylate cyclase
MQPSQVNLTQSAEFLRMALPLMSRHGIPVTPINYAVLYEYVSGANHDLVQKLDELFLRNKPIDNNQMRKLHDEFIDVRHEYNRLEAAQKRFSSLHTNFSLAIEQACENTSEFSSALDECKHQIEVEDSSPQLVDSLLKQLSSSTQKVLQKNQDLLSDLSVARTEIDDLKKQLMDAKRQNVTDMMTNLANRKAFFDHMNAQLELNKQRFTPSCLLMIDIDHFKNINDSFGHLFGDKVIKTVAEVLRRVTKGKDMAARFGGEEFIVHLPETSLEGAKAVAESIRRTIESASIINPLSNKVVSKVTVSLGIAEVGPNAENDEVIARADKALYVAKNSGRNRVCIAEGGTAMLFGEEEPSKLNNVA